MGRLLIVSKVDRLEEYLELSREYQTAFEINDFFEPEVLDDMHLQEHIIEAYLKKGVPKNSTLHGAFYDVAIFSQDERIREVSRLRMEQSMKIAKALGTVGVVLHTNYNPALSDKIYKENLVQATVEYLKELLQKYSEISIYLENMFDTTPEILKNIARKMEGVPSYGVCLDWAHACIYGDKVMDWVRELATYIKHIHINDNDLKRDLHLPLGAGAINWQEFVEVYYQYFSHCSVLIETNEPSHQRQSLEFLKKINLQYDE